jgi:hypothetical protein
VIEEEVWDSGREAASAKRTRSGKLESEKGLVR